MNKRAEKIMQCIHARKHLISNMEPGSIPSQHHDLASLCIFLINILLAIILISSFVPRYHEFRLIGFLCLVITDLF